MAILAHVLQLIGGWIAPLVIFFIRRQSRFVSFHALQVLLFEAFCILLTMLVMGGIFFSVLLGMSLGKFTPEHGSGSLPPFFLVFFVVFWLGFIVMWFLRLLLAIIYGIKAGRGEWAEYPVLGRFARKILHIGPGGVTETA
jgi:uncharacterized membrane protein